MSFFSSRKSKQKDEEIEYLRQEKETLRQSQEEALGKITSVEQQKNELARSLQMLETENKELKNKLEKEEPYEKIFNERKELLEKEEKNTARIAELESQHQQLTADIESIKTGQSNVEGEKADLIKEVEAEKAKYQELSVKNEELENKVGDLGKAKEELQNEITSFKDEVKKANTEKEDIAQQLEDVKQKETKQNMVYIEELRKELFETKAKVESMLLESEALKSENEALFRANESKKEDINEFKKELSSIKNELQLEQLRYKKLKQEWDDEKKRTEFVIVNKNSAKKRRNPKLGSFKEEQDSEDEHVVSIVEAATKEKQDFKAKEKDLTRKVSQLQLDKDELFRSGTTLFNENKQLKTKYDTVVMERTTLLQVEAALKRKVRSQEDEIKDLKKTIDDLYYQNMAIRQNEESEKKSAYVVVMGNERIKELEREKSALYRRVKFLEKENHEIETRVNDLERQSKELIDHSLHHDGDRKSSYAEMRHRDNDRKSSYTGSRRDNEHRPSYTDMRLREIDRNLTNNDISQRRHEYDRREVASEGNRGRKRSPDRYSDRYRERDHRSERNGDYRPPSDKPYGNLFERTKYTSYVPTKDPDYYKSNAPPFNTSPSRQTGYAPPNIRSFHSHESLPPIGSRRHSPPPRPLSPRSNDSRRMTPSTVRR